MRITVVLLSVFSCVRKQPFVDLPKKKKGKGKRYKHRQGVPLQLPSIYMKERMMCTASSIK